jgi:ABC-type amino acid transport substrate-binding protein
MTWDLLHHNPLTLESEITMRWIYHGLANYGAPIIAVLLLRYLGWRIDRSQPNSYLISYAAIFLVALCVAAPCLTVAQMLTGTPMVSFGQRLYQNIEWTISPAVVCIYMAYHVDRQIDPLLPDLGSFQHWRFPQRLMSCVFFGLLVTGFSVLPTLSITTARTAWPIAKLQIVILGTTFIIGLIMALVGEFLLVAPARESGRRQSDDTLHPARTRLQRWAIAGALVAALLAGLAIWSYSPGAVTPQWAFDKKPLYLGERIPLAWTYEQPASASVHFELESRAGGSFRHETCTDARHYSANRINASREWRVRAVADCVTKTAASGWSRAIEVTQYDSIYERIKSRGEVNIFVSDSQDQDIFKWGREGFDFDLAKLIVRDLSSRMGRELKPNWPPVSWQKLLLTVADRSADFAISSITKTSQREKKFSLQFTDSYYCTSYALIYRAGTQEGRIRDMLKGKLVGVQRETTSSELANKLLGDGLFRIEAYNDTESLQNALVASQIDLGVIDTSFAQSAQLDRRLNNGVDQLKFKVFEQDDLPSTADEPRQEYAIAVHMGEIELLSAINETLARAKNNGELAQLFETAAGKYEAFKKYKPGSRNLGQRPWECFGQTAVN